MVDTADSGRCGSVAGACVVDKAHCGRCGSVTDAADVAESVLYRGHTEGGGTLGGGT